MTTNWTEVCSPKLKKTNPIVSVAMISYNHCKYLSKAIEGVINQITNFPFELVISVDLGDDETLKIALQFQDRYPQIIRVINPDRRVGMCENFIKCLKSCRGSYIALCEGDDYWISNQKLQTQIQLLQNGVDLVGTFHDVYEVQESTGQKSSRLGNFKVESEVNTELLLQKKHIATCSIVLRNILDWDAFEEMGRELLQQDYLLCVLASELGNWKYIPEIWAVYRIHDTGIWSGATQLNRRKEDLKFFKRLRDSTQYKTQHKLLNKLIRNQYIGLGIAEAKAGSIPRSILCILYSIGPKCRNGNGYSIRKYLTAFARRGLTKLGLRHFQNDCGAHEAKK